jgi:Ca2+-binding RTX toxin-like protein
MRTRTHFAASLLALAASACSAPAPTGADEGVEYTSKSGEGDDLGALFGVSSAAIGVAVPSCSAQASSGFVASTGVFTLTLNQANTTEVIIAPVGTTLRVNGFTCVDATGAPIDLTKLTKLVINGTAGDDAVVFDLYLGSFNAKTTGTGGGGVVLALGAGGMDRVGIRGTAGVDTCTAGSNAGRAFVDFTGDGVADAMWTSTATRRELMLATAGGNDFLSGFGRATTTTAGALSATATLAGSAVAAGNIGALTSAYRLSAYGGPGNDRLQGGDGADLLDGGDGDDSFFTAASADGADVYLGGLGTDTVDYSTRTGNLSMTIALTSAADANDGATGENDDLTQSIENLTGGSGNDVLKGSAVSNVLRGGAGSDVLWGGPGGTCTADADQLFGDAGDDTFEMGAAFDCGDDLTGGAGTDLATYHDRANALTVSRDDAANDGEATEKDNVRADIEVLVGGQGADTLTGGTVSVRILGCAGNDVITGSSANDELSGGPGDDVLNGGAGNDVFLEHGDEPLCVSSARGVTASLRGLGSDVLNGGAGIEDKIDYLGRTAPLAITLCVDAAAATGVGTCGTPRNDGELGEGDAVLNTEIVEGGSGNDVITGSSADEWLSGNGGNDNLDGQGGNDHLDGGDGNNTLTGGSGADICDNYSAAIGCDLHVYACTVGTKRDCDRAPENACETDIATDSMHCGACGSACGTGQSCQSGACVGASLSGQGDTCAAAPLIAGGRLTGQSLIGFTNDYGNGTSCFGTLGPDRVYRVSVRNGERLTATVTPGSAWDPSINIMSAAGCVTTGRVCLAGSDNGGSGFADTASWLNGTGVDVEVYVAVETYTATAPAAGTPRDFALDVVLETILPGDMCSTAETLPLGSPRTDQTLLGFFNDYGSGTSCGSAGGPDRIYSVSVPAGERLEVTVTPTVVNGGTSWNPSINLMSAAQCQATPRACLAGADSAGTGAAEVVRWTNTAASATTVLIAVETGDTAAPAAGVTRSFTISANSAPLPPPPPGDVCSDTLTLISSSITLSGETMSGFTSNYPFPNTLSCDFSSGVDRAYRVRIPAGATINATITPDLSWDPTLNLVLGTATACTGSLVTCASNADFGYSGDPEAITYTNSSGSAVDAFIIVDSYATSASATYAYDLAVTITP